MCGRLAWKCTCFLLAAQEDSLPPLWASRRFQRGPGIPHTARPAGPGARSSSCRPRAPLASCAVLWAWCGVSTLDPRLSPFPSTPSRGGGSPLRAVRGSCPHTASAVYWLSTHLHGTSAHRSARAACSGNGATVSSREGAYLGTLRSHCVSWT